jgi:hypothetical protein
MAVFVRVMSVLALGGFLWVVTYLLPRAWREQECFPVVCALLTALLALILWLFITAEPVS